MSQKVIVTVKEGKIRGFKTKSAFSGTEYFSFLGVPYGQSTAERARFKDPVKAKPWNDVLDATSEREGCIQFSFRKKSIAGNEDCLYNNIHTPELPSKNGNKLKAVIVNIHPGGFVHGTPESDYYGSAEYIMNRDVVYICVGYRLHILGNLNLNLKKLCSGNQCLKDIILSLKWIKENIHVFGGDPKNITLLGSSAGSAIVHFLLLSPLAKGLYHKAILMGMYVFNPILITRDEHVSLARQSKDNQEDRQQQLNFYKEMDIGIYLLSKLHKFHEQECLQIFPCSPFLPLGEPGPNSPLPVSPKNLITSTNRVPVMIGFCDREGVMGVHILNKTKRLLSRYFRKALTQNAWGWGVDLEDDDMKYIQKEVEDFYLGGQSIDTASDSTKCDIFTDVSLSDVYDTLINVISSDPASPVYVYQFSYDGAMVSIRHEIGKYLDKRLDGAFHAADYAYWCYMENRVGKSPSRISQKEREIIETMTNLLTTFAKTGNPNNDQLQENWKPSTPESPCYLNINETLQVKDELLNGNRMEFWHNLKRQFKTHREN